MCNVSDAVCSLTRSECESLQYVGTGSLGGPVPTRHAEKLMMLGFVEVLCGRLAPTPFGRRAVLKLHHSQRDDVRE